MRIKTVLATMALALGSAGLMAVGLLSWIYLHRRWPEIGRTAA